MLDSCLEGIKVFTVGFLSSLFSFYLVVWLRYGALKIESAACSLLNVFRMIVLGVSVFDVSLLVDGVIVVVVIEGIDLVGISFGDFPDLVGFF